MGHRANVDTVAKEKSFAPAGNLTPIILPVLSHCTYWATLAFEVTGEWRIMQK